LGDFLRLDPTAGRLTSGEIVGAVDADERAMGVVAVDVVKERAALIGPRQTPLESKFMSSEVKNRMFSRFTGGSAADATVPDRTSSRTRSVCFMGIACLAGTIWFNHEWTRIHTNEDGRFGSLQQ
jgi:hypothetical protein